MSDEIHELQDLYDSERVAVRDIRNALMARHSFKGVVTIDQEEAIMRAFAHEARERCAEIGLVVSVQWDWKTYHCPKGCRVALDSITACPQCGTTSEIASQSPTCSDDPDDPNLYWIPRLVIEGRTHKTPDYDFDRQTHEVRSGLLDGKPGVIDPNTGEFREDPKKKTIY